MSRDAPPTVVAIMARSPSGGSTSIKTRLGRVLPDDEVRRRVYRAFLADTIRLVRAVPSTTLRLAFTPEGGPRGFDELGVADDELLPQRGADLGARERALFDDLFAQGHAHAIVMGSDFPTLPPDALIEAREALTHNPHTVVLGPADDGGYYLIGLSSPTTSGRAVPDLFTDIRWSTPDTLADTLKRAVDLRCDITLVQRWFDVDDQRGWHRLTTSLGSPEVAARARATAAVVQSLRPNG